MKSILGLLSVLMIVNVSLSQDFKTSIASQSDLRNRLDELVRNRRNVDAAAIRASTIEVFYQAATDPNALIVIAEYPNPTLENLTKLDLNDDRLSDKFLLTQPWYSILMNQNGIGLYVEELITGEVDGNAIVVMFNSGKSLLDKKYPTYALSGSKWLMVLKPVKVEGVEYDKNIFFQSYDAGVLSLIPIEWPDDAEFTLPFSDVFSADDIDTLVRMCEAE